MIPKKTIKTTSKRPYLIRAMYDWIVDNRLTPYLLVNTTVNQVMVPEEFIENNKIILNVNPSAIHTLDMNNKEVTFSATFSGRIRHIYLPIFAIDAIYAKENGEGMAFSPDDGMQEPAEAQNRVPPIKKRPALRIVK